MRIKAEFLQPGDIVITGETVKNVTFSYTGTAQERKKVYLTLEKNGKIRYADWNKATEVSIKERNANSQSEIKSVL